MQRLKSCLFEEYLHGKNTKAVSKNAAALSLAIKNSKFFKQAKITIDTRQLKRFLQGKEPLPYEYFLLLWRHICNDLDDRKVRGDIINSFKKKFFAAYRKDILEISGFEDEVVQGIRIDSDKLKAIVETFTLEEKTRSGLLDRLSHFHGTKHIKINL